MIKPERTQKPGHSSTLASQIVHCDTCGGIYNRSYLTSHERLAHKKGLSVPSAPDEAQAIDAIITIYNRVSPGAKRLVLRRLSACD